MLQQTYINLANAALLEIASIKAALIIGSFGRNQPKPNSDIDYQILVGNDFDNQYFFEVLNEAFGDILRYSLYLEAKRKWCFYLGDNHLLMEIFLCTQKEDLATYYLGSEIESPETAIIFDKTNELDDFLQKITANKNNEQKQRMQQTAERLIIDFQNRFESLSAAHAKSDGYKFSVLYSHALNAVVRLVYLCESDGKYEYMPPNFLTDYGYRLKLGIETMGTMNLREANTHKRKLLDTFLQYLTIIKEKFELATLNDGAINRFLENIFQRDFYWNLRDLSTFNPHFQKGVVLRTSSLTFYQNALDNLLTQHHITTIIDLRADRELAENAYDENSLQRFKYVHAPFDPWSQSVAFQNTHNTGTNAEIAYSFFMLECKNAIKKTMQTILENEGATAIHCYAGKDRTGIIVILLHLLTDGSRANMLQDYLASEMDSSEKLFQIVIDEIEKTGGILPYLKTCDLSLTQITALQQKICNNSKPN